MSILDVLPSLRNAAPSRFDPALWPSSTECCHGCIRVDGIELDDVLDANGSAVVVRSAGLGGLRAVTVSRVVSVEAGRILVAGGPGRATVAAAAVSNRHPLGPTASFRIGSSRSVVGSVSLPEDVRAGDVLAMVSYDGSAVLDLSDVHSRPARDVLLRSA